MSCILESTLGLMQLLLSVNLKQALKFLLLHLHSYTKRLLSTCNLGTNLYNSDCFVQLLFINIAALYLLYVKLNVSVSHSIFMIAIQYEIKDKWNSVVVLFPQFVHFNFWSMYFRCFKTMARQSVSVHSDVTLFFSFFWKQFNSKTRDGFTVNTKVPSLKDQGKEYDGFTITITGDKYVCYF